ncbi:MAG: hypothetical protein II180_02385 [Proteobacteria bacterium]|nr:hypothetical protein [Pseudomonadota bacterium]
MRSYLSVIKLSVFAALLLTPYVASAQIGPNLIPPGLSPDHPVDAYSKNSKKLVEDWRHEASWELNANDVVFSAAKKRQLISEAPSTIHVITDREIAAHACLAIIGRTGKSSALWAWNISITCPTIPVLPWVAS